MKSQELRFTETNSADDSQGKTWGLDGNLFWYIAGGSFVSVITLLLLFSALRMSFLMASGIAAVPFTLTLAYVFGFRQGKPPGYDVDCFDFWFSGAAFGPELARQPSHPLESRHV
jgi:hypothetical protein